MKSLKFASIILLFVLSCSKKEDLKLTDTSQLFGRWTFVKIYGDTYGTSYNVSEKSKNVIEFTKMLNTLKVGMTLLLRSIIIP